MSRNLYTILEDIETFDYGKFVHIMDEEGKMDIFVGCNTGWTFWLTNLKAYIEHGITLHAKGLKQDEMTNLVNS